MTLVYLALIINILIAGFFGLSLGFGQGTRVQKVYGQSTPASRILGSLYIAIALASVSILLFPDQLFEFASSLFIFQIMYKLLSIITVRNIRNPVVISNILITVLLVITLLFSSLL